MNVVYFTDGQGPDKYVISKKTGSYPSYRSKFIIHDPKTKLNHYLAESNQGCSSKDFLKIIKTRMKDVKVINFLITSGLMETITQDQRTKCLTEMGITPEDIANMRYNYYVRKKTYDDAVSKYIVIEQEDMESFDTAFICSTEMFKNRNTFDRKTVSVSRKFP